MRLELQDGEGQELGVEEVMAREMGRLGACGTARTRHGVWRIASDCDDGLESHRNSHIYTHNNLNVKVAHACVDEVNM